MRFFIDFFAERGTFLIKLLYLCTKFNEILYANGQIKDKTT